MRFSVLPSVVPYMARASNPQTTVYMNLQLLNGTATLSPTVPVVSYTTFSPLPRFQGGYFLLPTSTVANSFHFRKQDTLCCPDFPLVLYNTSDSAGVLP